MAGTVTVSAVVLSYARPRLLAQALVSLRAQDPAPDEIIVVDNPSPLSTEIDGWSGRMLPCG